MVDRDQDLGHIPEVQTGSAPPERGSDRFLLRAAAAVTASGVTITLGGPVGERIGSGLAALITRDPNELVVRAWGSIGAGFGFVTALIVSGIAVYRVLRR